MMIKKILFILICSLTIISCETEVDINDNYSDLTIVYGLLDQNHQTHYIKINKGFLGEENAYVMAQQADSSNYDHKLNVTIEEWKNNSIQRKFNLDTVHVYNKNAGDFYSPEQILYTFDATLDEDATYKLEIINTEENDKEISASTTLVQDFRVTTPRYSAPSFPKLPTRDMRNDTNQSTVKWISAINGMLYQFNIRFHYTETKGNITKTAFLDYGYPSQRASDNEGSEDMFQRIKGKPFFEFIGSHITEDASVRRKCTGIDLIFFVANRDLDLYMEVNETSNSIIMERPEYTNLSNGIGLFASRYSKTLKYFPGPLFQEDLINSAETKHLRFEENIQ